jgi:hypothetical protein
MVLCCIGVVAGGLTWATIASEASQRAHVHGVGQLNLVVEGTRATIEFEAPAESVYGFEHEARTTADKQKRDAALTLLRDKMSSMVVFEASLGCEFTVQQVEVVAEDEDGHAPGKQADKTNKKIGEHRAVHATFTVTCQKPLAGSQMKLNMAKFFPKMGTVQVQVVSEAKQSGVAMKHGRGSVTL